MWGIDNQVGTIEVGKKADIILLDQNLFEIDPSEIYKTKVLATMFDGKIVHDVTFGIGDSAPAAFGTALATSSAIAADNEFATYAELGLMQGFPPPEDKRVDRSNALFGVPYNRWSYQNMRSLYPTANIPTASQPVAINRKIDGGIDRQIWGTSTLGYDTDEGFSISTRFNTLPDAIEADGGTFDSARRSFTFAGADYNTTVNFETPDNGNGWQLKSGISYFFN